MKKSILIVCAIASLALAEQVEVVSDKFRAAEAEQKAIFTGNVKVTKGKDVLLSDKLTIYFDEAKQPLKYEATDNASIDMVMNGVRYFGSGERLIYEPEQLRYTIQENGFFHEIDTDRKVYGEVITVDQSKGTYEVDSKPSAPVKFIFQVNQEGNTTAPEAAE